MKSRIVDFLEKTKFFSNHQYGFRYGLSTQDAIIYLTTQLYKDLDKGLRAMAVFLDLQKAFDTVPHDLLPT